MAPSKFVPTVKEGFATYTSILLLHKYVHCKMLPVGVWQHRDETSNFMQKHDNEIIKEQKR